MSPPQNQLNQNQPPQSVDFQTDIKVDETLFRWSIKDLLHLPYENGKFIESPQFCSSKNPEIKWKLWIYPNGDKDSNKNNISVYLKSLSKSTKISTEVTFSFWNCKTKHSFKQNTMDGEFNGDCWGFSKFCSQQDFLQSTIVRGEIQGIIIVCKIITYAKLDNTGSPCLVVGRKEESAYSMSFDFNNLLESEKFADFTLVSSDGVEFRTHKAFLSARSPVFSAMLQNSTLIEVQQNRAVIADMDSNTLKGLVQYIYAGKCDNLGTLAKELLVASDKYQLDALKNSAVEALNKTMSLKNVLDILIAHLHNAPELKKDALYFMKLNSKEIVKICKWECFVKEYPSLVTELFSI